MDASTSREAPHRSWTALWQTLMEPRAVLLLLILIPVLVLVAREVLRDPVEEFLLQVTAPGMLRTAGAIDVGLGALGVKRVVRRSPNYFELREPVPWSDAVKSETKSMVTSAKSLTAGLNKLGMKHVSVGLVQQGSHNRTIVVRTIATPRRLMEEINQMLVKDPANLRLFGPEARIVTAVVEIHQHDAKSGVSGKVAGGSTDRVEIDTQVSVSHAWALSRGTVVAYRLARLCWAPDYSRVEDLRADLAGRSDKCPPPLAERS